MTDQIIDRRTVAIPGPASEIPGPPGLPGVNAVPADEAVATYVLAADSKTHAAVRFGGRDRMVVFGDSMTVSASPGSNWWQLVARRLGLDAKCYGVGGMGFSFGDRNFLAQLGAAAADSSVDRSRVRYVFVNGSSNDIYSSLTSVCDSVDSFASQAKAMYPNADLIGFAGLNGANPRWTDGEHSGSSSYRICDYQSLYDSVASHLIAAGFQVFTNSYLWLLYNFDLTQADGLHPNDQGHAVIANYVASGLANGVYSPLPSTMGASLRASNLFGVEALNRPDLLNWSQDYYLWRSLPSTSDYLVLFNGLAAKLSYNDVVKWGADIRKNADGNITEAYSLDIPIARKIFPLPVLNTHISMEQTRSVEINVNNVSSYNPKIYLKRNDNRLSTPSDARYYLWARFDAVIVKNNSGNGMYNYNLLNSLDSRDASKTVTVSANGILRQPIMGIYNA